MNADLFLAGLYGYFALRKAPPTDIERRLLMVASAVFALHAWSNRVRSDTGQPVTQ